MSFKIERGLFKFDFIDHHAILGIPVNAEVKEVRKRYLKIARNLHPDSCKANNDDEKKQANELLTKLVNPAYEQLSRSNRDYLVSLSHLGKRLAAERQKVSVSSASAKELAKAGANLDLAYKSSLNNLASKQYDSLDNALDAISEISELNLVYLMLKGNLKTRPGKPPAKKPPIGDQNGNENPKDKEIEVGGGSSRVDEYIRRAEGYMAKNNFAKAVLELREALKLDPNSSRSHSLMGFAYLKQNQAAMAKVHINKALQLNPKDERALTAKKFIEQKTQKQGGAKSTTSSTSSKGKSSDTSNGGGLFGLFGGKKK